MTTITVHAQFGKTILKDLAIDLLHSGKFQPRDIFSEDALISLAATIEHLGILEPIIVRHSQKTSGCYEIIAGERRFRAAKKANLSTVPCLLTQYSDEQTAQVALIENTAREALDPIAEATAMYRLVENFRYTHDEIASLLGVSRTQVTNMLRLLRLDARIQHWMKQGALSEGHGKILAGIRYEDQYMLAYYAIEKHWSVLELDHAAKMQNEKNRDAKTKNLLESKVDQRSPLEKQMIEQFGSPVKIKMNKNESGSIQLFFHNREHMQKILGQIGFSENK
jgi:ParB family chromosome partitioning protein